MGRIRGIIFIFAITLKTLGISEKVKDRVKTMCMNWVYNYLKKPKNKYYPYCIERRKLILATVTWNNLCNIDFFAKYAHLKLQIDVSELFFQYALIYSVSDLFHLAVIL